MNHDIDQKELGLTQYVLGELGSSDDASFDDLIANDPELRDEMAAIEKMAGLISASLEDEWKSNVEFEVTPEAEATRFALGDMSDEESVVFAADRGEELEAEIEGLRDFGALLSSSFEREWQDHVPVDLDAMDFTDYALGEADSVGEAKLEATLRGSEFARKELAATQEFSNDLKEGLEDEWRTAMATTDMVEEVVTASTEEDGNVVHVDFSTAVAEPVAATPVPAVKKFRNRKPAIFSIAAVATGLAAVGAMLNMKSGEGPGAVVATGELSTRDYSWVTAEAGGDDFVSTSSSLLEVEEPLDSIHGFELANLVQDPFGSKTTPAYLSDLGPTTAGLVNVSMTDTAMTGRSYESVLEAVESRPIGAPVGAGMDRVDSYLPAVQGGRVTYSVREGLIDGNSARSVMLSDRRLHENGLESVLVQGIVTFPEGSDFDVNRAFSTFDHPAKSGDVASELDNITAELEALLSEMERGGDVRESLRSVIERQRELSGKLH